MDTGRWRPCAYSLYRRTRAHHVYRSTRDTSLLWTQTVMRKPLVLWTAVWMLLLRHIFGSQLQERVQQNIIREYLGEQPVGTAFVIETGNSKHPWLVPRPDDARSADY
ncbi:caudovirales tail fibre assembly protein [Salmonella enterica subsp. enterica]|uniref:Caudovirales tail fibre assembly protein n=1 Tax=Salmonella enterica I TaxID=59201 RepID=A0A3S4JE87_SALET|nr:caudovirales tail fibre assembly protein [Salmonella enterica subsp. enterica]